MQRKHLTGKEFQLNKGEIEYPKMDNSQIELVLKIDNSQVNFKQSLRKLSTCLLHESKPRLDAVPKTPKVL